MGCIQSSNRRLYTQDVKQHSVIIETKPVANNRPDLTDDQKQIVRETWNTIKLDISRIGVVLFMRLFEKYPDVQQLFVHFRGMSADELRHNKRLRDHGLRVLNTLDKCITRIDEPDRLEKLLLELGQKHVVYNIKVEHLYLLIPQLQQALMPVLGEKWTYLVESACERRKSEYIKKLCGLPFVNRKDFSLLRLFEKYPDVQQLFMHFRGISADELRKNKKLRDHGLRVLNTLDKCISRIDETESLEKLVHELGQKHAIYKIKKEHLHLLIPQLKQALMPALGDKWTNSVESAWSAFLKYVIFIMEEAMSS